MAWLAALHKSVNLSNKGIPLPVLERTRRTRAEQRRQHVKETARRLFVEHGFHNTGIALIARESGVAVQQLYRDFPAKEDIIAAIVEDDCKKFADLATLDKALALRSREGVRDWLTSATSREDEEGDRLFLEIAAEAARNDRIKQIFLGVRSMMFDNISRAFAGLTGGGAVTEEHHLLAEAFMMISIGSVFTRIVGADMVGPASGRLVACLLASVCDDAVSS